MGIAVKMTRSSPRRASPMFLFQGWRLELQRAKMMKGEVKKNCMSLAMYLEKKKTYFLQIFPVLVSLPSLAHTSHRLLVDPVEIVDVEQVCPPAALAILNLGQDLSTLKDRFG